MNDQIQQLQARTADLEAQLQARIADLEARIYAIDAGGVGASIQPQAQPDTAPAAWAIFSKDGTAMVMWSRDMPSAKNTAEKLGLPLVPLYTAPQPTENLRCKSTQKRLATLWGYVKQDLARQPLTDEKLYALYCEAMKGYYVSALHYWRKTEAHKFARVIEAAHGITGGQQ